MTILEQYIGPAKGFDHAESGRLDLSRGLTMLKRQIGPTKGFDYVEMIDWTYQGLDSFRGLCSSLGYASVWCGLLRFRLLSLELVLACLLVKEAEQRLAEAKRKLSRMRGRCRATMAKQMRLSGGAPGGLLGTVEDEVKAQDY
ncbi:hypothetical protein B296_00048622 [Ensete ventricosum]|uniref:Uncharacterized protein n=1 Tax=Ensete ventricosum TaxID=4639 RepID=A0A426XE63_ENSVE|nr:hypothetical protein B296_00048622 [Ensete ventricosum]